MKKLVLFLSLLCIGTVVMAEQVNVPGPKNFQGDVYLAGTKLTATAAQLNQAGTKASAGVTNVAANTATVSGSVALSYTTNILAYLDATTNAVSWTNVAVTGVAVTTAGVTTNITVSR